MNVATLVPESATGLVSVAHVGQMANNLTHAVLALYADASHPDSFLTAWLQMQKKKVPTPVLLVRFETTEFTNERLETLLDLGFDGWIMGQPSPTLVEKICAKISQDRVYHSPKYGQLLLRGDLVSCGVKKVKFSFKESSIFRLLLDAGGKPVTRSQLLIAHGYRPDTNTHTIETHIYRMKDKLKQLGIEGAIYYKNKQGYILSL
jgi:DNA-binding response OmpR family regulator